MKSELRFRCKMKMILWNYYRVQRTRVVRVLQASLPRSQQKYMNFEETVKQKVKILITLCECRGWLESRFCICGMALFVIDWLIRSDCCSIPGFTSVRHFWKQPASVCFGSSLAIYLHYSWEMLSGYISATGL